MVTILRFLVICLGVSVLFSCSKTKSEKKVLIFSKTAGFRHNSIEKGTEVITDLLENRNIGVTATEDASYFNEDSLQQYSAVIFLNTTGDILNTIQQLDFERYIQAGGGYVGIHAATDTEYQWPWYNKLAGAYFDSHPRIQDANLTCVSPGDPCCEGIPETWTFKDEWYNFKSINPDINVIMNIDESSYTGGKNGENHPMVWKHNFDGGRAFYTGLGHRNETFSDSLFQKQLLAGIDFAIGDNNRNYAKAVSERAPEENRFSKQVLDFNLDEPMEIDELGDRGILFIERRGALKLYEYETSQTKVIDSVDVFYANEDGLLGMAIDPNFEENNWIYFFYSPNVEEPKQHISRFTLENDQLTDEKVLLEVPTIRECCHSGGSLEFGPDGLLYIGLGDNTNPFKSNGYAPIDERPDRELFDAQRSAANTNDLRGKILRIKPEPDGSYSIPEGNLFAEGTEGAKPEIYVMGLRNPFRFSIDSKNSNVYWGDVGPDAGKPDSLRGPDGRGEFNQAKKAGFYGWPYSRGNNAMYVDYDFAKKESGEKFDPNNIINDSPNNTGLKELPPIQESLIWYGYKKSKEFPWIGAGGINPMSGPIYYSEDYTQNENALPSYYDGKWFVYEWMRDWIYTVELDENQNYVDATPFMPNTDFSHPMDMLFSKDGTLYILEYGQKWNSRNLDARLSVIHYNGGNRPPVAEIAADQEVGAAPLSVNFSAAKSLDYDKDKISYTWMLNGEEIKTKTPELAYVFEEPGVYDVKLKVTDSKGAESVSGKKIMVGNAPPKINIELSENNRIYHKNQGLDYKIEVIDQEDGSTNDASIDPSNVKVTLNYIPEGKDMILASVGHQQTIIPNGLKIINSSDCKACHAVDTKVAGPSYKEIAERYSKKDKQTLVSSIIKGSQGKWGETMMSPHPQLDIKQVGEIVDYILSLKPQDNIAENYLPLSGTLEFDKHEEGESVGKYVLMVSYLDKGNAKVENSTLSAVEEIVFIPPKLELENAMALDRGLRTWKTHGKTVVGSINDGKNIKVATINFDKLSSVSIGAAYNKNYNYGGTVEIRKGNPDGTLLGKKDVKYFDKDKVGFETLEIDLERESGLDTMYLVFKNSRNDDQFVMNGDWIQLNYGD